ncbi:hypothetical protein HNR23_003596 [Nocardiopsis mwathae]|uniref:Uncharacterized protein n=1 Tax=Nocardiopsis mwathae TaxID=1472723 RepID=A0A7W9YL40_9ACTN|nr:hypothetical protein [Nocardiopsis mwathae]MBB6173536.1 hypothetical protein [Nocardiopsis mwathae]
MPGFPDDPTPDRPPRSPGARGREYPEGEAAGGYHLPEVPTEPTDPTHPMERAEEPEEERGGDTPLAAERFRRATPARSKAIPALQTRHRWRLVAGTVLFVMFLGSWADYIEEVTRVYWHLAFWALVGIAAAVTVHRERRNDWEATARWPWAAAALGGSLAAELLIATLGSPIIMVGSVILLALGLFLVLMFG